MKLIKDLGVLYAKPTSKSPVRYGLYQCPECPTQFKAITTNVKRGNTTRCKSCHAKIISASRRVYKEEDNRLRGIWQGMKGRCLSPADHRYEKYGALGIGIDNGWLVFSDFKKWAYKNGYSDSLTIDRINNEDGYFPENCRWVDMSVQLANKKKSSRNTIGYIGVQPSQNKKRFVADVEFKGKSKRVGTFDTALEAHLARVKYIKENNLPHYIQPD